MTKILAFIFFITAGTSVAAENSLPGNLFYPFKVNIAENIRSALLFTPESKAKFEVERADRRLEEIETLALKKRLKPDQLVEQKKLLRDHTEKALVYVSDANDNKLTARVQSDLEAVLKLHATIIDQLIDNNSFPETQNEIEGISDEIESKTKIAVEMRQAIEARIKNIDQATAKDSSEKMLTFANSKLEEVERLLNGRRRNAAQPIIAEADNFLKEAQSAISQGDLNLANVKNSEAFIYFYRALRLIENAKRLVSIDSELDEAGIVKGAEMILEEINSEIGGIRLRARLAGTASGSADFEERADRTKFKVEIANVAFPAGSHLKIFVGNTQVAALILDKSASRASIDFDSREGEAVPGVHRGDEIIIEGPNGFLLTGIFEFKDLSAN